MDVAGVFMRNAAAFGTWPAGVRRPTGDPAVARLMEAALVLGGHALVRLDQIDIRTAHSPEVALGDDLTALALAQAIYRQDASAVRALLPGDLDGAIRALVAMAGLYASVLAEANPGRIEEAFATLREQLMEEEGGHG